MGSAVESAENASFVDRIRWSKKTYTLRMLLEFRKPPCIVNVPEGYRGSNDVENLPPGLVVRINSVFAERRIFARCADGRVFSIPETFPIKFEVIKKNRKRSKAKRLDEILRNYRPPIVVALDRRNNRWTFRNGKTIQSEDSLGTMVLIKAYFEHFALVNQLIDGAIDRRVFLIPLYLDLDVRLAEGLRNENTSDFTNLLNMYSKAVGSIDYSAYTGLNAILEFDSSAGSVHPLAASRHLSMENSIPGVSDSRTVTDDPTLGVRGSLASGSQGRARRGVSEGPQQRRRGHSEDLAGTMTIERGGNRLAVMSETKFINMSTDDSISGGSSAEEPELPKETAGRVAGHMSRRKGRSAEELQERPKRRRNTPEVASLDRLPEVSQATISRRPEVQTGRHVKENQTGSTNRSTGRGEEQAKDDATLVSTRSRSRNPVTANPTPKPRKARSRRQSENSSMSVPPAPIGNMDHRQGQSVDRTTVALNKPQGWTSSPAPNYHIHINIQSPNSPLASPQFATMSSVDGHSAAVHRTPATTGQMARPFPDNEYLDATTSLDERPTRQTFARQESRPDILPQPARHAHLRYESRKPKVTEVVKQVHVRQESYPPPRVAESYPPPRVAESVRHAYIRNPPSSKFAEPFRSTYIRQETYPRDNPRWNSGSNRRFFRDFVPTMFKSRPSERRSTSGRIFVSSVSCTGGDYLDLPGKNNFANESHRSHGLCSKVIRLKNGEDSEIAELELKEFYGRTSTIRSAGNYVTLANGEVNNNLALSSAEFRYPFANSADERSNPRPTKKAATQIELPAAPLTTSLGPHETTKFQIQDRSTAVDGGRTREVQRGRNWILRSGIQKPDNRSVVPRQSLGTTIAV